MRLHAKFNLPACNNNCTTWPDSRPGFWCAENTSLCLLRRQSSPPTLINQLNWLLQHENKIKSTTASQTGAKRRGREAPALTNRPRGAKLPQGRAGRARDPRACARGPLPARGRRAGGAAARPFLSRSLSGCLASAAPSAPPPRRFCRLRAAKRLSLPQDVGHSLPAVHAGGLRPHLGASPQVPGAPPPAQAAAVSLPAHLPPRRWVRERGAGLRRGEAAAAEGFPSRSGCL